MDTKLDWCGDALCGMGVIRSLSRLISNGLGGGGHCWPMPLCQEQ